MKMATNTASLVATTTGTCVFFNPIALINIYLLLFRENVYRNVQKKWRLQKT